METTGTLLAVTEWATGDTEGVLPVAISDAKPMQMLASQVAPETLFAQPPKYR
jgi:hypothetical protein